MALAAGFYTEALWKPAGSAPASISTAAGSIPELARRFGLGLAPEGWECAGRPCAAQGLGEDALVAAGLVVPRQSRQRASTIASADG